MKGSFRLMLARWMLLFLTFFILPWCSGMYFGQKKADDIVVVG